MKQDRLVKAQSITKKIISEYFITHTKELTSIYWIITITQIDISSDLSYMDVYASAMMNPDSLTKDLSSHAHTLQKILGKEIAFVKVPKIRFKYDQTGEDSSQIYTTIKNLNK